MCVFIIHNMCIYIYIYVFSLYEYMFTHTCVPKSESRVPESSPGSTSKCPFELQRRESGPSFHIDSLVQAPEIRTDEGILKFSLIRAQGASRRFASEKLIFSRHVF